MLPPQLCPGNTEWKRLSANFFIVSGYNLIASKKIQHAPAPHFSPVDITEVIRTHLLKNVDIRGIHQNSSENPFQMNDLRLLIAVMSVIITHQFNFVWESGRTADRSVQSLLFKAFLCEELQGRLWCEVTQADFRKAVCDLLCPVSPPDVEPISALYTHNDSLI